MPPKKADPEATTGASDPLEKAEAKKEKGGSAMDGMKGEAALDEALGDDGDDFDPEETSAADDPLEKAEATKESK